MSELIDTRRGRNNFHYSLLATVSSAALLVCAAQARAADTDGPDAPTIWIEVDGGFDQISAGETGWLPPNLTPPISNPRPLPFGKLPATGFDADLKLSFAPKDSDWVYSASIQFGRAQRGPKRSHDQSYKVTGYTTYFNHRPKYFLTNYDFIDTMQQSRSAHAIIDFMAGKDVGLGIFGGGKSVFSAGVRIAQLNEEAHGQLTAFTAASRKYGPHEVSHKAELLASRSFTGLGPAVSWDASASLLGSQSNGLSVDWGANGAILFGRQKANVSLHTKDTQYFIGSYYKSRVTNVLSQTSPASMRNRFTVVPNVGGFAGFSWHLPNAKVSLGYRADFFFGAIDGGLLTSQKKPRGLDGPFANISIGVGG